MSNIAAFVLDTSMSDENITQRRLIKRRNYFIVVVMFIAHMLVCTTFFALYEGWPVSVAMYFVIDTTTSVGKHSAWILWIVSHIYLLYWIGFGYQWPSDDISRAFSVYLMLGGVCIVFGGLTTSMVGTLSDFNAKRSIHDLNRIEEIYSDLRWRLVANIAAMTFSVVTASLVYYMISGWSFVKCLYFVLQIATVMCH